MQNNSVLLRSFGIFVLIKLHIRANNWERFMKLLFLLIFATAIFVQMNAMEHDDAPRVTMPDRATLYQRLVHCSFGSARALVEKLENKECSALHVFLVARLLFPESRDMLDGVVAGLLREQPDAFAYLKKHQYIR